MSTTSKSKKKQQKHSSSTDLSSVFYLSFIGELIEIVCSGTTTTTEMGIFPVVATGYLLEIDDDFLYLSDDAETICRAIRKSNVITVEVVRKISESEQALLNMSVPSDVDSGN